MYRVPTISDRGGSPERTPGGDTAATTPPQGKGRRVHDREAEAGNPGLDQPAV